jgi:uncharacterized repeat protein (TIGR03803 family)
MPGKPQVLLPLALVTAACCLVPSPVAASARATTEQVLHSFAGPDGAGTMDGVTAGPGGVLYGAATFGGSHGGGCVFSLTPRGSGYTERVLFSFDGKDGATPGGGVALGAHGDLFGDTVVGGAYGDGTAYELVPDGTGYTEKVLHDFTGGDDGNQPIGTPVLDSRGDVFGVTQFGGTGGIGVVYEMRASATGYTERVLHNFPNAGGVAQAGLTIASDGTLYGTNYGAGETHQNGYVFRIELEKTGPVFKDLFNFNGKDGGTPFAPVTVDNHTGVIYGTTQYGGTHFDGTVFSLSPSGSGYTERVLYSFGVGKTGNSPEAPVLRTAAGDLFGTTDIGGTGCHDTGCGTVFELTPDGPAYAFHEIYRFTGPPDGAEPEFGGLIAGPGGEYFGATRSGGTATRCTDGGPGGVHGCGTVFRLTV